MTEDELETMRCVNTIWDNGFDRGYFVGIAATVTAEIVAWLIVHFL